MIVDRISLNLAYSYLKKIQDVEAGSKIKYIMFSSVNNYSPIQTSYETKLDLIELKNWINIVAPEDTFCDIQCKNMSLYMLKSFTIERNGTTDYLIKSNERTWSPIESNAITPVTVDNYLKKGYQKEYNDLEKNSLLYDEYILVQRQYVECKYIEVKFIEENINYLKQLYMKYK